MMNANEFLTLRNAMDRLFQDSFNRWQQTGNGDERVLVPRADAWESEDEVTVEMALPGVSPENVDITVEQDTLTIQGTFPPLDQNKHWILRERPHGTFQRRFNLHVPVDVNNVSANYRNGLLILTLPKSEESKPRRIEVRQA
ncbi:MAG: Hsp20/alpha crystallin family protein [Chloroflexota bacterium]|nr:Hsp20/alpha crystallin family protein [Chloroflexota bacterium]